MLNINLPDLWLVKHFLIFGTPLFRSVRPAAVRCRPLLFIKRVLPLDVLAPSVHFSNHPISSYNIISYIVHMCLFELALRIRLVCCLSSWRRESSEIDFLQNVNSRTCHDFVINNEHAELRDITLWTMPFADENVRKQRQFASLSIKH